MKHTNKRCSDAAVYFPALENQEMVNLSAMLFYKTCKIRCNSGHFRYAVLYRRDKDIYVFHLFSVIWDRNFWYEIMSDKNLRWQQGAWFLGVFRRQKLYRENRDT